MILRYPKIVDDGALMTFSTPWGFENLVDFNNKHWQERIEEYLENERLLEKTPKNLLDEFQRLEEAYLGRLSPSARISFGGAISFAIKIDIQDNPRVREALSQPTIVREDFVKVCLEAKKEAWATEEANEKIARESPDMSQLVRIKEELKLEIRESEGVWALHFFIRASKRGGTVLLGSFRTEKLHSLYSSYVLSEFHPKGTDSSGLYGAGEAIVMHELWHALDKMLSISDSAEFQNLRYRGLASVDIAKEVSRYATTNNEEFIAEAFCEYKLSASPRPVAMAIGHVIDNAYRQKFGEQK